MKKNRLKLIIFISLILGITAMTFFFMYRGVPSQSLADSLPNSNTSENSAVLLPNLNISEESEEYAVYSVLLNELFAKDNVESITVQKQTLFNSNSDEQNITEKQILNLKKLCPSVSEETLLNYIYKQMESLTLSNSLNLPVKYTLVDEIKVTKHKAVQVIRLSRIGFDRNRTEALVYVELINCPLCGGADFVQLEKKSGVWKIKERVNLWVS